MEIKGEKVVLVPIKPGEKDEFYKLATQTEGSKFWYGKKGRAERTKDNFFQDWNDGYFDIVSPEKGQCFWIIVNGEKIGQINYNKIDLENKKVELDIIIGNEEKMGKGYGTDALKTLMKYLFDNFDINKILIEARLNNPRAIKAYEKVGFKKEGLLRQEDYFEGKFTDCVKFGILRSELSCN
ncbi:MAG: GNAT family protein [Candidatus Pacebacteria bacterium]|nr:GNAT family protein [Candidatus Paceibacterota bacterium]